MASRMMIGFDDQTVRAPRFDGAVRDSYESLRAAALPQDSCVLLIDASGLAHRAFYLRDSLEGNDGSRTAVLHGMLQMVVSLCRAANTRKWLLVWDGSVACRRNLYKGYKQRHDRQLTPEEEQARIDFRSQLGLAQKTFVSLNAPSLHVPQIEADDAIGMCSRWPLSAARHSGPKLIVSDDRDMYQLLRKNVWVWRGVRGSLVTWDSFVSEHGFVPTLYDSYKALVGEPATGDNIPGVPGVGSVRASQLVGQHGHLEAVLAACAKLCRVPKPLKLHISVWSHADQARLSLKLSRIMRHPEDMATDWGFSPSVADRVKLLVKEAMFAATDVRRPCQASAIAHLRGDLGFVSSFDANEWSRVCGFVISK